MDVASKQRYLIRVFLKVLPVGQTMSYLALSRLKQNSGKNLLPYIYHCINYQTINRLECSAVEIIGLV